MDYKENPIDRLLAKFKRAGDFEVTRVNGFVEEVGILQEDDSVVYVVSVRNMHSQLCEAFWMTPSAGNPYIPKPSDRVTGYINSFDDSVQYADWTYRPIFELKNETALAEESHFAWFKNQARLTEDYKNGKPSPDLFPAYREQLKREMK
jgi:hypothetical protein